MRRLPLRGLAIVPVLMAACLPAGTPPRNANREPMTGLPLVASEGTLHEVVSGETLYRIAKAHAVPVDDLCALNELEAPDQLRAGAVLYVPRAQGAMEAATPDMAPPARPGLARRDLATGASGSAPPPAAKVAPGKLEWPVDGIVTSRFGQRGSRKHDGIDISAPEGSKILAAETGTVLYAGSDHRGYGNMIILKHDGGLVTIYAHNRENVAREGERVSRGQLIAKVGQTGRAEGPHLHFEVRQLDKAKNPLLYLP